MLFRNRRLARATACYLLLQTASSLAFPSVSMAMMGPSQPEFTSYEAPGATDMVNLSTGDFSYSIPVLDIPGPERSVSLPLTYKAGIQLEQEASWVGLGWSLNPGAIARSLNGYADDAVGEEFETTFNKQVSRGWYGGVPGVLDLGWNSISGHSGSASLLGLYGHGWDENGINSVNLAGVTYTAGSGVSVDPVKLATAAITVATLGTVSGSVATDAKMALTGYAKNTFIGVAAGSTMGRMGGVAGYNGQPTRKVDNSHPWNTDYWDFYNNNTTESAYGSLYFGKMSQSVVTGPHNTTNPSYYNASKGWNIYYGPQATTAKQAPMFKYARTVNNTGNYIYETAADVYQDDTDEDAVSGVETKYRLFGRTTGRKNGDRYWESSKRPISIAHDYFSVMGETVSGTIRPNRLEVGNIAYPKLGVDAVEGGEIRHYKHMVVPFLDDYKVGFRYENSLSNGYKYHEYTPAAGSQAVGFELSSNNQSLTITDPRLYSNRTEGARKGLHNELTTATQQNRQFVQGKQVTWYSNREIIDFYVNINAGTTSNTGADNGFLEYAPLAPSANSPYLQRYSFPRNGIGAFAVTAEDGTTYHYSLPVYQYQTYTEANEVRTSATIGGLGKSTRRPKYDGRNPTDSPEGTYATTWLLTAVTSADYIDRNHSGTVDEADWGGWVKYDYGKFSSRYKWRQPYIGNSYSDDTTFINNLAFTEGYKQTYYLNSIATRSHTALFVKSVRQDGRGHFKANEPSNLRIDETKPASALKLDEVVLLDNATLKKLQTINGIKESTDPNSADIPALSSATSAQFGPFADAPMNGAGDDMNTVLDGHDLDGDSRIRSFIDANAVKRIRFNYSYDLCRGTPNSFAFISNNPSSLPSMTEANMSVNRGGKLTLKSISFFGPTVNGTPTKITPDFTFGYDKAQQDVSATNPGYGVHKWDAFGMYAPNGQFSVTSHKPQRGNYPAPWSLTRITSPLGGSTEIEYERDEYAHVSEYGAAKVHLYRNSQSSAYNITYNSFNGPLSAALKVNDYIYVTGRIRFDINYNPSVYKGYVHLPVRVSSINGSQVTLDYNFSPDPVPSAGFVVGEANLDAVLPNNTIGGDIRVASITTKDDNAAYQVKYKYTNPTSSSDQSWVNSSGVIAKEPAFLDRFYHPINTAFDYPSTPVIYGRVTVLRGLFRANADDDYETKEVYSFFTPSSTMISDNLPSWQRMASNIPVWVADNRTTVDVGKIAQPQKIEAYNHRGEQELSTTFTYASTIANPDGLTFQGHYTEGVLNNEQMTGLQFNDIGNYRINRSTKEYVPAVLVGSRSIRNGVSNSSNNVLYDFYTGQVLETSTTSSLGKVYHTRSVPAYTLPGNENMGAKGDGSANHHMLSQIGASYSYMERPGGPAYNPLNPLNPQTTHILAASVQTWQKGWANYREADINGTYQDVPGQIPVWRQAASYAWRAPKLGANGSFGDFTPFSWTSNPGANWLKTGDVLRYDHYSHPVETRDANGNYAAQKTGYEQMQLTASAAYARYTELAYSGAEDPIVVNSTTHFGGEVIAGGTPDKRAGFAHTGFYSNQLNAGQKGFIYRVKAGQDIDLNKTYRLNAWVHSNAPQGKLYAELNGTRIAETSRTSINTKKAGDWYLLTLLMTVPNNASGQMVEFGCINEGAIPGNFDDFRMVPLTATMTSKVYNPRTNSLLYSLDNDNLFTHYEYTPTNRLRRIYQETLDGTGGATTAEKLVKEYEFNYARLLFPTWVTSIYSCETDANGNNTGRELRQVVDVNPLNIPPAPSKWEVNGTSDACAIPTCSYSNGDYVPSRVLNNICEQAYSNGQDCVYTFCNGRPGTYQVYHWVWPDNTPAPDTYSDCQPTDCVSFRQAKRVSSLRKTDTKAPYVKRALKH